MIKYSKLFNVWLLLVSMSQWLCEVGDTEVIV